jgi:beta-lactam-binding protein with PASTA domain
MRGAWSIHRKEPVNRAQLLSCASTDAPRFAVCLHTPPVEVQRWISYIFEVFMANPLVKLLKSPTGKKFLFGLVAFILLFLGFNDLLMPWYVRKGGIQEVPPVVGMSFNDAKHRLDSLGFETRQGDIRMDREHPAGIVIAQNPLNGDKVKHGRRVYLTVSGGEIRVAVPNLKGRTMRDAKFALEREGLKLGTIDYATSEDFPASTVFGQSIPPETNVKRDTYVSITVSQGSSMQKVGVPDITGKTLPDAEALLVSVGLKKGNVTYIASSDMLPNTVVDQYPRVGEMVLVGQAVDLFVVQEGEKHKDVLEN